MAKHDEVRIFENVGGGNEDFCGLSENLTDSQLIGCLEHPLIM